MKMTRLERKIADAEFVRGKGEIRRANEPYYLPENEN